MISSDKLVSPSLIVVHDWYSALIRQIGKREIWQAKLICMHCTVLDYNFILQ